MEDTCKSNEMVDIDYMVVNKIMNMVDSDVNRNDILMGIKNVLNKMLMGDNVSDKIIESIALKLSQGFYIYADYMLPVMLLQLIQKEINGVMKNACEDLSSDITLIIKDGQILFEESKEYTIGLTRKNGVTMYCQTTFT